jgi:hypothetical protein
MTAPKLLLPIRVPELGPHLGKLVTGTGRAPGGVNLDEPRYRLVTRIMDIAGEARRLAARGDRGPAVAAIGRTAWLEAWEELVAGVAELLMTRMNQHLTAEAEAARMPARRRRRVLLGAAAQRALTARLGSAGAPLVRAVDDVEARAAGALVASGLQRHELEAWQSALKTAARRLEASWLALEDTLELEVARWRRAADEVASWRRSMWPVVIVGVVALSAAIWLGLVVGGFIGSPAWLTRVWQGVFAR